MSAKILIIDDDDLYRKALVASCKDAGYDVFEAVNGKEGLDAALKEHPDLILSDILMPEMDGLTMVGKLRDDAWGSDAHIVLLTNSSEIRDVQKALSEGAFDYLVKTDWSLDQVLEKVKEKLSTAT